jgi:hypothetical protein
LCSQEKRGGERQTVRHSRNKIFKIYAPVTYFLQPSSTF